MILKSNLFSRFAAPATEDDFADLYRAELPRIYNFFRFRVGDGPLAEDLTSATFEKAWCHRHRYRRDLAAFSTWLFSIAQRVAIDHYRKQQREVGLEDLSDVAADTSMEDIAHQRADFSQVSALLAQLSGRERELVALKYGAGLTNRAIAQMTGLSESHVGSLLHRVRNALRAQCQKEERYER